MISSHTDLDSQLGICHKDFLTLAYFFSFPAGSPVLPEPPMAGVCVPQTPTPTVGTKEER
jgi:hypothetical protein